MASSVVLARSAVEIMADLKRLGLEFEADEIEKLVATEARRRELEGDTGGVQEFYNDRVRPLETSLVHPLLHKLCNSRWQCHHMSQVAHHTM